MALTLRNQDFVEALRVVGRFSTRVSCFATSSQTVLRRFSVNASLVLAGIVIAEATLSFLGVGVQEPTPLWVHAFHDKATCSNTRGSCRWYRASRSVW